MEGIGEVEPALHAAEEGEGSQHKRIAVALVGLASVLLATVGVMIIGTTLDQQAAQQSGSHYLSEAFATGQGSNSVVALDDITDAELYRLGGSISGLGNGPDGPLDVLSSYEQQAFLHRIVPTVQNMRQVIGEEALPTWARMALSGGRERYAQLLESYGLVGDEADDLEARRSHLETALVLVAIATSLFAVAELSAASFWTFTCLGGLCLIGSIVQVVAA
jgi:hypothetical protein